ncbi:sigma 54-interacting transcriptional regulator [Dasania marina]|uniref:sigma-54 interaction domain-containing protein n=1 Tax=Dasania marina TaxID=471499 RepID=UPI0030DD6955|tara:strand:- start:68511 stop:69923 length:1413 start_codon:yes stop_codon:yes gene_type:complete
MKFHTHSELLNSFKYTYESAQALLADPALKLITDALPYGLIILDQRGVTALMNTAAERINQLSLQKDFPFRRFVRESAVNCEEILKSYQQMTPLQYIANSSNGEDMLVSTRPILDKNGDPLFFVITQNISFDINGLAQRRASSGRFKSLADQDALDASKRYLLQPSSPDSYFLEKGIRAMKMKSRILLTGESGAGKTSTARYIHEQAMGMDKPFIHVNCASIPDTLFESELFGYEKGAFTGAHHRGKIGFLEAANGGTLFLDEIGEIPLLSQPKLLQFLETNTVQRLGTTATKNIQVRIISATNKNLLEMISKGEFRQDLYYRLCVIELKNPPLRDTKDVIPQLIEHFLAALIQRRGTAFSLSKGCYKLLLEYDYPGNIRELQNILEHIAVECDDVAGVEHLPSSVMAKAPASNGYMADGESTEGLKKQVHDFEATVIAEAIEKYGSKRQAALVLGVDVATITRKTQRQL